VAQRVGDDAWRRLLDAHEDLSARIVADSGGRIVKSLGDGVLAEFDIPSRAVLAAGHTTSRRASSDGGEVWCSIAVPCTVSASLTS
jgi:class 3 adenylate cyclase